MNYVIRVLWISWIILAGLVGLGDLLSCVAR